MTRAACGSARWRPAIGSAAIAERYAALGGAEGRTVREIFDRLGQDEAARVTIDEVARVIATAVLAVHSVIDPEIVVMGGSIGVRPELTERIAAHLAHCMPQPARIEISALGSRATLIGAIGSAIDLVHRALFGVGAGASLLALPSFAADVAA